MKKPSLLWEGSYLSLYDDGEISVYKGFFEFVGIIKASETSKLYEALRKYYGDDKLKHELAAMKKQRNEAWLLINDLLEGTGDSRSNAIALLNELENRIDQLEEGLQND